MLDFDLIRSLIFGKFRFLSLKAAKSDWVVVEDNKFGVNDSSSSLSATTKGPSIMSMDSDFGRSTSNSRYSSTTKPAPSYSNGDSSGDASKRFANAKSISSDQYFGRSNMSEVNSNSSNSRPF